MGVKDSEISVVSPHLRCSNEVFLIDLIIVLDNTAVDDCIDAVSSSEVT